MRVQYSKTSCHTIILIHQRTNGPSFFLLFYGSLIYYYMRILFTENDDNNNHHHDPVFVIIAALLLLLQISRGDCSMLLFAAGMLWVLPLPFCCILQTVTTCSSNSSYKEEQWVCTAAVTACARHGDDDGDSVFTR